MTKRKDIIGQRQPGTGATSHEAGGLGGARRRAVLGPLLVAVGAVHVALTPLLYPEAVRGVLGAGVLDAVQRDPEQSAVRSLGFWYATTGIGLLAFGWAVSEIEHRDAPLPRALPAVLLGLGAWGVVLLPKSPFWVFVALAVLAEARRRRGLSPAR